MDFLSGVEVSDIPERSTFLEENKKLKSLKNKNDNFLEISDSDDDDEEKSIDIEIAYVDENLRIQKIQEEKEKELNNIGIKRFSSNLEVFFFAFLTYRMSPLHLERRFGISRKKLSRSIGFLISMLNKNLQD